MHITTMHTLAFTIKCVGNDQYTAATAIIKGGAETLGTTALFFARPLADGEDNIHRNSMVHIQSDDYDKCELYWSEVVRALAFIGVEATSP